MVMTVEARTTPPMPPPPVVEPAPEEASSVESAPAEAQYVESAAREPTIAEPAQEELPPARTNECPICGRQKNVSDYLCVYCGRTEVDYSSGPEEAEVEEPEESKEWVEPQTGEYARYEPDYQGGGSHSPVHVPTSKVPVTASFMILIAGVLGMLNGLYSLTAENDFWAFGSCCSQVMLIFGILAFIGGVYGLKSDNVLLVTIGGVFGVFAIGFFLGTLLSLAGLALLTIVYLELRP